jgi:hypothetical protein
MGAAVPTFKKLQFKMEGISEGDKWTPLTISMSRLTEYLADLAIVFGYKESVHLIEVAGGSAMPVILYDAEEEGRIFGRMRAAQAGNGDPEAVQAYKRNDARFKKDQGFGRVIDVEKSADIIEFPGAKQDVPETYVPIKERATLVGRLRRVGGKGDTIPIWLERADGLMLYCETSEALSRQLSDYYLDIIRVHGIATWLRNAAGEWKLQRFNIQSYDMEALSEESLLSTIEKLQAIKDSGWENVKDPLEELRRMRHGDDEPKQ